LRFSILTYLLSLIHLSLIASEGNKLYEFQSASQTLYHISCGTVSSEGWKIKRNSCNFYTSTTEFKAKNNATDKKVYFKTIVKNSGNLESRDFAWVFYYLNDKVVKSITIRGDVVGPGVTLRDTFNVSSGDRLRMRVSFVCDKDDELWILPDRGVVLYEVDYSKETEEFPELQKQKPHHKIIAKVNDSNVNVTWHDNSKENDQYYLVERSSDGRSFEFAGYVKSGVTYNESSTFSFIDKADINTISYYRVTILSGSGKKVATVGVASIVD